MTSVFRIGIDEVGRGPVAGPVVVCACAIEVGVNTLEHYPKGKLLDSKKLTSLNRKTILEKINNLKEEGKIHFGIGYVDNKRIDEIGISPAIKESLKQALEALHRAGVPRDSHVYLDGSLKAPQEYIQETIIKGDEKVPEISLASIYAKEFRDDLMKELAREFPLYHFENHVGYGTRAHYEALKLYGPTRLHRMTFLKVLNVENEILGEERA